MDKNKNQLKEVNLDESMMHVQSLDNIPGFKKIVIHQVARIKAVREKIGDLEYHPLVLERQDFKNERGILESRSHFKEHVGNPNTEDEELNEFQDLNKDCIISRQINNTKTMVCVTMYNEPYSQVLESLAGIYRAYYELVAQDKSYEDSFSVCIICDGFPKFNEIDDNPMDPNNISFAEALKLSGLYDEKCTSKYMKKSQSYTYEFDRKMEYEYLDLDFMTGEGQGDREYETHNLAHCFSRKMFFTDFLDGLTEQQQEEFMIENYDIIDFMLGSSDHGMCKKAIFDHLAMNIHFVIKHKNRGKIESHLWFFKGFCEAIQPRISFIIDAGTIPLWNSMSKIIFHMEANRQIGGASGEIEVMLPEKNPDGSALSFFESILIRSQYCEYKISHYLDKATESLFGFVSVLPGAFSAFRWEAIKGEPLAKFLKGQALTDSKRVSYPKCKDANMYLAEDRIM